MVESRKGIGYIIEALAALMVLFIFVMGNAPSEPNTNWNSFQQELMSQDITLVMEKTGDADDFIRNGETGTLVTMAQTLSQDRLSVSGTIDNVPISTQVIGFHTVEADRDNVSLDTVQNLNDECYENDDLEEIEPEEGDILRSENPRDDTYLYVADTDPDISGGDGEIDPDSLWVDNGTRCQFSAAEGPYYIDDFFYWGNGTGEDHYDINNIYNDSRQLELYLASQIVDLKPTLESRMNGIDTGVLVDTMAADRETLQNYDILVFRERDSLDVLNSEKTRLQRYLSDGSMLLMMDLEKQDFYNNLGGDTEPADNFITSTGLRWVNLSYRGKPSTPAQGSFNENPSSEDLETYFLGLEGDKTQLDLRPSGNVTSSNSISFKDSEPLLSTGTGSYDRTDWNATNYSMEQADPDVIQGYPETECVGSSKSDSLTNGTFEFADYEKDSFKEYSVINVHLGEEGSCDEDVRAVEVDLDGDGEYTDPEEGPYLGGEQLMVENKTFTVNFPNQQALEDGDSVEFVYNGESAIESVNYRTSFTGFKGQRLARMGYKTDYSTDEKKIIASTVHWLSDDNVRFGSQRASSISTEAVGGVKENTFIPYKILIRWK